MEIDVETVAGVALEYERSADALVGIADSVSILEFGPEAAGHGYAAIGERIGAGYDVVESSFRRWGDASKYNALRLRSSAAAYSSADAHSAHQVDSVGAP